MISFPGTPTCFDLALQVLLRSQGTLKDTPELGHQELRRAHPVHVEVPFSSGLG